MPSFFEGLKRMITGQPVFRPGEDADGIEYKENDEYAVKANPDLEQPPMSRQQGEVVSEHVGPKITPQAVIERVECRISGKDMDVSTTIKNNSPVPIMLDKILIMGLTHELDRNMRPGEAFEFVSVYRGPRPNHRNYTRCEVYYRDEQGDYFSAIHNIEFEQEADDTYMIHNIEFLPPVKDI